MKWGFLFAYGTRFSAFQTSTLQLSSVRNKWGNENEERNFSLNNSPAKSFVNYLKNVLKT